MIMAAHDAKWLKLINIRIASCPSKARQRFMKLDGYYDNNLLLHIHQIHC